MTTASGLAVAMFDFLNLKLSPKVRCTAPSMDGYETENLISPNELTKSRGFLAYISIRPPVDLDFELICPISIGYVFLSTVVGSQKTNGVELLAKSRNCGEFVSVAKAFFSSEEGVFFCNSRLFSKAAPPANYSARFYLCFLKRDAFKVFMNASEVRVRILRTERSVPCLGRVEIWGRVSKMCSETTANTINKLMQPVARSSEEEIAADNSSVVARSEANFEVPEEYKDALTYEIMAIPLTLPSGSTVDQTTLEKYIENEASYGRQPSDPFTGLKFTESRKPVLNTALKSRIDMFLIQNSEAAETKNASRTVGKSNDKAEMLQKIKELNAKRKAEDPCEDTNKTKTSKCNDEDLNALIQKTVNSKNFIRFTAVEERKDEELGCGECGTVESLYILPCNHLYCRKCLMDVCSELECKNCRVTFTKADPKKFHAV